MTPGSVPAAPREVTVERRPEAGGTGPETPALCPFRESRLGALPAGPPHILTALPAFQIYNMLVEAGELD